MGRFYEKIKKAVSAREAAEAYGIRVNRSGMACCPFHDDHVPSMKVDQNFICFGCGAKGDVIDFAAKLFGLTPYEAAKKLITDMGLTVGLENRTDVQPGTHRSARRERMEKQQFEQAVSRIFNIYCEYFCLMNKWSMEYAPRSPDEEPHPLFVEAMQKRDYVKYLLDLLLDGSKEDKALILIDKGKEAEDLERRIRNFKSGDGEHPSLSDGYACSSEVGGRSDGDADRDGERTGQKHSFKRCDGSVL